MRIMIVTDAWFPQTNGVVNTLAQTAAWLVKFGHELMIAAPRDFRTVSCPSYPEIRMAVRPMAALARKLEIFRPQAVHIATEGPLGFAARRYCLKNGWRFTTSRIVPFWSPGQNRTLRVGARAPRRPVCPIVRLSSLVGSIRLAPFGKLFIGSIAGRISLGPRRPGLVLARRKRP